MCGYFITSGFPDEQSSWPEEREQNRPRNAEEVPGTGIFFMSPKFNPKGNWVSSCSPVPMSKGRESRLRRLLIEVFQVSHVRGDPDHRREHAY